MDKKRKVVLPVSSAFDELSRGAEITAELIVADLLKSDKDLGSKTQHNISIPLTKLELLAVDAESFGFKDLAKDYRTILKAYRINQRSVKGWLVERVKEMIIAELERSRRESERVKERLVGRGQR